MNRKIFLMAMLSGVLLWCSSCTEDDYYPRHPGRPGTERPGNGDNGDNNDGDGKDDNSSETKFPTGVEGDGLSYTSWIEPEGGRQTVTLNAEVMDVNAEIDVASFELGNQSTWVGFEAKNSRQDGNITVTDSLRLFNVSYDNFGFSYEQMFQTARYHSGKAWQQMASVRFAEDIAVNEPTVSDLSPQTLDGFVYARKLFRHSITVSFNGVEKTVGATIVLRRKLGSEGVVSIIDSKLDASGITGIKSDGKNTIYTSWIRMKQTNLNGAVELKTYELPMSANMLLEKTSNIGIDTDITRIGAGFDETQTHTMSVTRDKYIFQHYTERVYLVRYSQFSATAGFMHSSATYDDGISVIEFPHYEATEIKDGFGFEQTGAYADAHGTYKKYLFTFSLSCKYGNQTHRETDSFEVVVPQ